ncbi:hypothetical protein C8R41DRAFT_724874, partial [Lentinula lateritia]
LRDIRDSPVFKEIPGPDGKPFMQLDENSHDLPVMFSLGYDAFHPFHFSNEKSHISSTAIYMVNLCLPEHLRYKKGYMALVTVFNGDPNVNDINHIL